MFSERTVANQEHLLPLSLGPVLENKTKNLTKKNEQLHNLSGTFVTEKLDYVVLAWGDKQRGACGREMRTRKPHRMPPELAKTLL